MKRLIVALSLMLAALVITPQTATADYAWAVTKNGETSPNVTAVQYLLTSHGIATDADGSFGPATQASVESFQSAKGLEVDGVVGENTWSSLVTDVQQGSEGDAVAAAQTLLDKYGYGLEVDGIFGPATHEAVVGFQSDQGLEATGVVDATTWRYLTAAPAGSTEGFALPIPHETLARDEFDDPHHDYPAIDLPTPTGTPAYAVTAGTATAFVDDSCGNGVNIELSDGSYYTYCHFDSHAFSGTQAVEAGTLLGYTGNTGHSTGPHLHFGVRDSAGTKRCPQAQLLAIYDGSTVPSIDSLATSGCSY